MMRRLLLILAGLAALATPAHALTDAPNLPKPYCFYTASAPALTGGEVYPARCDSNGVLLVSPSTALGAVVLPAGATQLSCHSGNQANADAVCTLAGAANKTTWITGFRCNAAGATSAALVGLTLVGAIGGTQTYTFGYPAGATAMATAVTREFSTPLQASAVNTDIVVTLPAGGTGNTNAACNAEGFRF